MLAGRAWGQAMTATCWLISATSSRIPCQVGCALRLARREAAGSGGRQSRTPPRRDALDSSARPAAASRRWRAASYGSMDLSAGQVIFDGDDISTASQSKLRPYRRRMQMVFQDPYGSLNTRAGASVRSSAIRSPFKASARPRAQAQGAGPDGARRPQSRALQPVPRRFLRRAAPAHRPSASDCAAAEFIVCDEPVSALDVSIAGTDASTWLERAAGRTRTHVPLHLGTTWSVVAARERSRGGNVPGQDRRDCAVGCTVRTRAASVHVGPCCRLFRPSTRMSSVRMPRSCSGRPALAARSAGRMPLPSTLPPRTGAVRRRSAATHAACRRRTRACDGLSLPAGRWPKQ